MVNALQITNYKLRLTNSEYCTSKHRAGQYKNPPEKILAINISLRCIYTGGCLPVSMIKLEPFLGVFPPVSGNPLTPARLPGKAGLPG
jgi:hypothetical protein